MLGRWQNAIATDAIDKLDSQYGLTWLVRAEAHLKLGNNDRAIVDFNRALENDEELGIEERAMAGLETVDGPVFDEDELEDFEKTLHGDG
jgi:tetratricopeptide (TPR) repeat protein